MPTADDELARLRALVGPSEVAYAQLDDDLRAASDQLREAALVTGQLRGELTEMSVQLARARQDQDTMQRRTTMGPMAHLADLCREYWHDAVRPAAGRLLRRTGLRRG